MALGKIHALVGNFAKRELAVAGAAPENFAIAPWDSGGFLAPEMLKQWLLIPAREAAIATPS
jgi:hypothetical protein